MTASVIAAAVTTPTSRPFVVHVGGADVTSKVPVGDVPFTIEESDNGAARMSFTVEDTTGSQVSFLLGELVDCIDKRGSTDVTLFGGFLVETDERRRESGRGRLIDCTATGWESWLDWRVAGPFGPNQHPNDKLSGSTSSNGNDGTYVRQLLKRYGGPLQDSGGGYIETTNTAMPPIPIKGLTLREALDKVAETATTRASNPTRRVRVDHNGYLHYWRDVEEAVGAAPYRIADGSYTTDIVGASGLVEHWRLNEPSGTLYGSLGYADGTTSGGVTRGVASGIPNEPGDRACTFDGSDDFVFASGANLHPGNTFTVELWFRRSALGSVMALWSGGTDDVEIGFDASDRIQVVKEGTGDNFVTDQAYTNTSLWYHLMVIRSPGTTTVCVNGVSKSGTATARTFSAGSGTVNIGRRKSGTDRHFSGRIQAVSVYSTAKTVANALAHFDQGWSLTPEDMRVRRSAFDGREAVYVRSTAKPNIASRWVFPGQVDVVGNRTLFGRDKLDRHEVIDRPALTSDHAASYGAGFLKAHNDPLLTVELDVTGFDGWKVGQVVHVTDSAHGLDDEELAISGIRTEVGMGSGVLSYHITCGAPVWSGARTLARRTRRRR